MLLTEPHALPTATRDALTQLAPERIVVLGGHAAVGSAVTERLDGMASQVDRIGGSDRYDTAMAVAADAFDAAETVLIATGAAAPHALAGAAASGRTAGPVLLTRPDGPHDALGSEISRLGATEVVVLGGEGAIRWTTASAMLWPWPAEAGA